MKNILIINGHQPYDFSKGELTQSLIDVATHALQRKGLTVKQSRVTAYDINEELEKWQWADAVIFQFPSNWMMMPWSAKKYMDDLFFPLHCNFRFFAMEQLPTFACFDVVKNPQIEQDLKAFEQHILACF